ncbi:bacteriocin immunity protein [Clostridium oceanicum]|uniref:Bacteriocin immunity protein n=1 Tax=Clostridium oceanicum TaxID=1543 RepID=A0ABP3UUH4_9CLOT
MNKKEKRKEMEDALLARVYDLILNPETLDDERSMLVEFKNAVENGKDFQRQLMNLAEDLRLLALRKVKYKKTLSKEVRKLYLDIFDTGFFERELGRGIATTFTVLGRPL